MTSDIAMDTRRLPSFSGKPEDWENYEYLFLGIVGCRSGFSDEFLAFDGSAEAEEQLGRVEGYAKTNRLFFGLLISTIAIEAAVAHSICRQHRLTYDGRGAWKGLLKKYQGQD